MGNPVTFRVKGTVNGRKVKHFRIDTDCGVYKRKSITIHKHKFHARWGPSDQRIDVAGTFTDSKTADVTWSVGYLDSGPGTPSCLAHDDWTAHWDSS